jgi:hypothetical protein
MGWSTGVQILAGKGLFLFTIAYTLALEPTHLPIQWVPGVLSLGVKYMCEADHSLPSSAKGKNVCSYTSNPI